MRLLVATRYTGKPNKGTSDPAFFECDDGKEYLLKFHKHDQTRLLFNEFVCHKLAKRLDLPAPAGEVVRILPRLAMYEPYLNGKNDSVVFGTERILKCVENFNANQTYKMPWYKFIGQASINLGMIPDIMTFDMWILNQDRAGL